MFNTMQLVCIQYLARGLGSLTRSGTNYPITMMGSGMTPGLGSLLYRANIDCSHLGHSVEEHAILWQLLCFLENTDSVNECIPPFPYITFRNSSSTSIRLRPNLSLCITDRRFSTDSLPSFSNTYFPVFELNVKDIMISGYLSRDIVLNPAQTSSIASFCLDCQSCQPQYVVFVTEHSPFWDGVRKIHSSYQNARLPIVSLRSCK